MTAWIRVYMAPVARWTPSRPARYHHCMRITVLYFAVFRERLGRDHEHLELPAGATVADAITRARGAARADRAAARQVPLRGQPGLHATTTHALPKATSSR